MEGLVVQEEVQTMNSEAERIQKLKIKQKQLVDNLFHLMRLDTTFNIVANPGKNIHRGFKIGKYDIDYGDDDTVIEFEFEFEKEKDDGEVSVFVLNNETKCLVVTDTQTGEIFYDASKFYELSDEYQWANKGRDNVNSPVHYASDKIEVIDFLDQVAKKYKSSQAFYVANIIKYVARAPMKNGLEDLKKAQWYLNRLVERWSE